mmetsp:Transcript_32320/g.82102  ORF Transcript_32320/g.82102 Transcript_32320/m.82102 type:complete len:381 (-) Transcript_32320:1794-2936(-)
MAWWWEGTFVSQAEASVRGISGCDSSAKTASRSAVTVCGVTAAPPSAKPLPWSMTALSGSSTLTRSLTRAVSDHTPVSPVTAITAGCPLLLNCAPVAVTAAPAVTPAPGVTPSTSLALCAMSPAVASLAGSCNSQHARCNSSLGTSCDTEPLATPRPVSRVYRGPCLDTSSAAAALPDEVISACASCAASLAAGAAPRAASLARGIPMKEPAYLPCRVRNRSPPSSTRRITILNSSRNCARAELLAALPEEALDAASSSASTDDTLVPPCTQKVTSTSVLPPAGTIPSGGEAVSQGGSAGPSSSRPSPEGGGTKCHSPGTGPVLLMRTQKVRASPYASGAPDVAHSTMMGSSVHRGRAAAASLSAARRASSSRLSSLRRS